MEGWARPNCTVLWLCDYALCLVSAGPFPRVGDAEMQTLESLQAPGGVAATNACRPLRSYYQAQACPLEPQACWESSDRLPVKKSVLL